MSCCNATITNQTSDEQSVGGGSSSGPFTNLYVDNIYDSASGNNALINTVNPLTTQTSLSGHIASSIALGTTSNIVGISDTQTLTNKTFIDNIPINHSLLPNSKFILNVGSSSNTTTIL